MRFAVLASTLAAVAAAAPATSPMGVRTAVRQEGKRQNGAIPLNVVFSGDDVLGKWIAWHEVPPGGRPPSLGHVPC